MRCMIIVKATKESEAGVMPSEALLARMGAYHEELVKAGVLLDGSGLKPSREGWRVHYDGDERTLIDGPFAETKSSSPATRSSRSGAGKRRGNGRGATRSPQATVGRPRSRSVDCSSSRTSALPRPSSVCATSTPAARVKTRRRHSWLTTPSAGLKSTCRRKSMACLLMIIEPRADPESRSEDEGRALSWYENLRKSP
jgi:hypothetical protein